MIVARAAPCTPNLKEKIKIGSKIILTTAPINTVNIPILAKPWLLIKLFIPKPIKTNTVPNRYMLIYSLA